MSDLHPRAAAIWAALEDEKPQSPDFHGDLEAYRTAMMFWGEASRRELARHLSDAYEMLYRCGLCQDPDKTTCGCWEHEALHEEREEIYDTPEDQ